MKEQLDNQLKIKKSHIHGTNGFMVPLPNLQNERKKYENQYIGIGHFHRPNDRNKNPYAKFGHHYTHVFYTIKVVTTTTTTTNDTTTTTAYLTSLSNEFLLPSATSSSSSVTMDTNGNLDHRPHDHMDDDAHVIQFISGLEYNMDTNEMIIAYGINDCEGAITSIKYETIQKMLLPVQESNVTSSFYPQVVDFMQPLKQASTIV